MAFQIAVSLIVLIGAVSSLSSSKKEEFHLKGFSQKNFMVPIKEVYELFGPGKLPTTCLNLTTQNPVKILVGGCNVYTSVGVFGTGFVPLNRSIIEKSIKLNSDKYCNSTDFDLRLESFDNWTFGSFNVFKCCLQQTQYPSAGIRTVNLFNEQYQAVPETWSDRNQQIRFQLTDGNTERRELKMEQAIHAAIVKFSETICFEYLGVGFVKLVLTKCQESQNISVILNSDLVFGLSNKEKSTLKKMANEKCIDNSEDWWIDIAPIDAERVTGALNVYACTRLLRDDEDDDAEKPFPKYSPNTKLMSLDRDFYFYVKPFTVSTYSADLKNLIDVVNFEPDHHARIRVEVSTTAPIALLLTRCKQSEESGKIIISNYQKTGTFFISQPELKEYFKLSMSPKCGPFESDESLYLHVKTDVMMASGTVRFVLDTDPNLPFEPTQTLTTFAVPMNLSVVREYTMDRMIDAGIMSHRMIGYEIHTTERVALFVSKCRNSKRQLMAGNIKTGLYTMKKYVINEISKLFNERCDKKDRVDSSTIFLHMESHNGVAVGDIKFVSLKYVDGVRQNVNATPFTELPKERQAQSVNQKIVLTHHNTLKLHPSEVDLRYFTDVVLHKPYYNMEIKIDHPTRISIVFSKCQASTEKGLKFDVKENKVFSLEEIETLHKLMRTRRCNNTAKHGLFLHILDETFKGVVTIQLSNFRKAIKNNGGNYSTKNKVAHTVAMPLGNMNRSVSIRLTNTQSKPVQLFASICAPKWAPVLLWNDQFTVANIKLDPESLFEFADLVSGCPTSQENTLFLSIRSEHAEGKLTIDKTEEESCDGWSCVEYGTIKYLKNTTGWIIAQ